ncbi:hypothetical protein N7539_003593 [Penicillium diatomitis]|uniref:GDP/GTP exchange factor Sec2 N-terminal domain-containing protein n=1 Tax=Penicillium diatomitis TaxID=2819901 RepID=A0A9W9XCV3_9EURO|nr:uncharacterized protein N7539_003593 [Penicillium diatomitis]KAJ5488703.1 hypothetical protein N7539_003593 [Penicillium diatomitis]
MSTTTTTSTSTLATPATTTRLIGTASAMGQVEIISAEPCPACGGNSSTDNAMESQRRIEELEGQVRALTVRAATAANKLADYEDELHRMRASQAAHNKSQQTSSRPSSSSHSSKTLSPTQRNGSLDATAQPTQSRLSSLTSFLPYRRASAAPPTASATVSAAGDPQTPTTLTNPSQLEASPAGSDNSIELQDALNREKSLRKAAESQLSQASTELEELTVQLFSQANEMVAQERKARAKLEERVAVLERRDNEKRARLERLENAVARIERLKALVNV